MNLIISSCDDASLRITDNHNGNDDYPTSKLQKGLVLLDKDQELSEEGIGFGVPIIKKGLLTIFPGELNLAYQKKDTIWMINAIYKMNLEEKIDKSGFGIVENKLIYFLKFNIAALYRRIPLSRDVLTALSSALRWLFRWKTTFEQADECMTVTITYTIYEGTGRVNIDVDLDPLFKNHNTEIIVMNEQGANYFNRYQDTGGTSLCGKQIGAWDEVTAEKGAFICDTHRVAFTLERMEGARLFRGRELVGSRLAWAGFGYSISRPLKKFNYDIQIDRIA